MSSTVIEAALEAADVNPAAPAFIAGGQVLRYELLPGLVAGAARDLQRYGLRPGDVVGVTMTTSPLHVITLLAVSAVGACTVPLHPQLALPLRERLAHKYSLVCVITDSPRHLLDGTRTLLMERLPQAPAAAVPSTFASQVPADAVMRIQLTSGTAGEPKGVALTHRQVMSTINAAGPEFDRDARLLTADPHVSVGFYSLLITLCRGGCLIFPQRYDLPTQVDAVVQHAVTHMIISPPLGRKMLPLLPARGIAMPSLRQLRMVGGAPGAQLLQELARRVSPNISAPYTLTEMARVTAHDAEDVLEDPRSAGRAGPGVELRIVDATGAPVAAGTRGEIAVRRRGMPTAYVNDAERSLEAFRNGWFHSGDLGYLSEDGRLYVEGRMDDTLIIAGTRVTPSQVEDFLMQHPAVQDAAVLLDGAEGAETLTAVVVLREAPRANLDFEVYCRPLGPRAPTRFVIAAALPRNAAGKVMRSMLRHELAAVRS